MADDNLKNLLNQEDEQRKKQFGLENTLKQILWDGQVPDDEFNDTFSSIIYFIKKCIEDENYKKQLYEIDLNDYKGE